MTSAGRPSEVTGCFVGQEGLESEFCFDRRNKQGLSAAVVAFQIIKPERHARAIFVRHQQAITFETSNLANLEAHLPKNCARLDQQLQRCFRFGGFRQLSRLERFARAPQDERHPRYSGNSFFCFIKIHARPPKTHHLMQMDRKFPFSLVIQATAFRSTT